MNYEKLTQAGIDIDSFVNRLMGNANLIRMIIQKFVQDSTFEALAPALSAGDLRAAEMASHTLKGVCGNLSLTQLYQLFTRQTSLIRAGELAEAQAMMPQITSCYQQAVGCMKEFLAET